MSSPQLTPQQKAPSLAARFEGVKTRVGGNREKLRFEFTMGPRVETQNRVTLPSAPIRRILGELEFALALSRSRGGAFDAQISAALDVLEGALAKESVLTATACNEAEAAILPLQSAAKEYKVLCASHAHIDMNWMWGFQETVAVALATFRTVLGFMEEYPGFTFSQSQASVYKIVEQYDPQMMEEIKARIREGRWEVTATSWVETDKNMPDTESLLRHIRLTREYLQNVWGAPPESFLVDFSPDTFGHSAQIPEIDRAGGVRYMYHCRGFRERHLLYRWRAPSGAELLNWCEPYWYNSKVNKDAGVGAVAFEKLCGGLKTTLIVYGVGDHGGGPTRQDIENLIEMQGWPVFPAFEFGRFRDFFTAAEAVRDKVPLVEGEINYFATGCYTTQSRIKRGNRQSERALLEAGTADAVAGALGATRYPAGTLEHAWHNVLFTHFHDILTGSCVQESREHAIGLYAEALAAANTAREKAYRHIAGLIDTSAVLAGGNGGGSGGNGGDDCCAWDAEAENDMAASEGAGAGHGIEWFSGVPNPERGRGKTRIQHVFNPTARARQGVVEVTLWDWVGNPNRLEAVLPDGTPLPFWLATPTPERYWDHVYYKVLVDVRVPAFGYATFAIREKALTDEEGYPLYTEPFPRADRESEDLVLDNGIVRAVFDPGSGALVSLVDKATGEERLDAARHSGLVVASGEFRSNSAWQIGRVLGEAPVTHATDIRPLAPNPVRQGFTVAYNMLGSSARVQVTLDSGANGLCVEIDVDWNERAKQGENVPVLVWKLALKGAPATYLSDIPAGFVRRAPVRHDIPGLTFTAALYGGDAAPAPAPAALLLSSDSKYGYRGYENALSVSLINTACSPDPDPERGMHKIRLYIAPLRDATAKAIKEEAQAFNAPLFALAGYRHTGTLPPAKSLLAVESDAVFFSSANAAGAGGADGILCRFVETTGKPGAKATLTLPFPAKTARVTDIFGRASAGAGSHIDPPAATAEVTPDGQVVLACAPYRVVNVLITGS